MVKMLSQEGNIWELPFSEEIYYSLIDLISEYVGNFTPRDEYTFSKLKHDIDEFFYNHNLFDLWQTYGNVRWNNRNQEPIKIQWNNITLFDL
jgi:hypothetical protein